AVEALEHPTLLELRELDEEARRELAAAALGPRADDATVARVVERAGGWPLFVEETAWVVGAAEAPPESLTTLLAARTKPPAPAAPALRRAGGVFGERFWPGAAAALTGRDPGPALAELLEADLVRVAPTSRFAGERELAFRHVLLRDAAYSLLTEE